MKDRKHNQTDIPTLQMRKNVNELLERQKTIANNYIDTIRANKSIIAVLGLGSLARGYGDEFSDIDLGIIFTGKKIPVPQGECLFNGHDIDKIVMHEKYYKNISEWPIWMRESFSSAIVLYSQDSKITNTSVRRHVAPQKLELQYLISEIFLDLAWHGITREDIIPYNTPYILPPNDFLVKRVGPNCAIIYFDYALQQIIKLFYFANKSFPPIHKWLLYQFPYRDSETSKLIHDYTQSDSIKKKIKDITTLLGIASTQIKSSNLLPKDVFSLYTTNQQKMKWGLEQFAQW